MSTFCMPMLIINMGGEMVYILEQRLHAQNVPIDKSKRGAHYRSRVARPPCAAGHALQRRSRPVAARLLFALLRAFPVPTHDRLPTATLAADPLPLSPLPSQCSRM